MGCIGPAQLLSSAYRPSATAGLPGEKILRQLGRLRDMEG